MLKVLVLGMSIGLTSAFANLALTGLVAYGVTNEVRDWYQSFEAVAVADDNLERYAACIRANDNGDARATVAECADDLRDWKDSPTFKQEWATLLKRDSQVRAIIRAYNKKA